MHEQKPLDENHLDDQLVKFTDRILETERSDGELDLSTQDELRALQETVILLKKGILESEPDQEMADRMRANLVSEWRASRQTEVRETLWERVRRMNPFQRSSWQSSSSARRNLAMSFAVAAVIIVIGFIIFSPPLPSGQPAAAFGAGKFVILFVGVVAGLFLIWTIRRKD
jgi:hypothetical protein